MLLSIWMSRELKLSQRNKTSLTHPCRSLLLLWRNLIEWRLLSVRRNKTICWRKIYYLFRKYLYTKRINCSIHYKKLFSSLYILSYYKINIESFKNAAWVINCSHTIIRALLKKEQWFLAIYLLFQMNINHVCSPKWIRAEISCRVHTYIFYHYYYLYTNLIILHMNFIFLSCRNRSRG